MYIVQTKLHESCDMHTIEYELRIQDTRAERSFCILRQITSQIQWVLIQVVVK